MTQIELPYLLDFVPLQDDRNTRISPFFDHLKEGRLTTTKCIACGEVLWQPRVACSKCSGTEMEWVDLPTTGTVFAYTAMIHGKPLGIFGDTPFVIRKESGQLLFEITEP